MDLPGRIGRYAIVARLASGATAAVFRARDEGGGAPDVALKRLHPHLADEPDAVAAFLDEARIAARLDHPAAIPVLDVGCDAGAWFIVMERVEGTDLAALLRALAARGARLPAAVSAALVVHVAEVLGALHALRGAAGSGRGPPLVHGDVAPANLLLSWSGEVKLADLGACAQLARGVGGLFGTPGYVAPEVARGERPGPASDLFAAGAVLHALLTGHPAWPVEGHGALGAAPERDPGRASDENPEVPPGLEAACARAHALDPARRFQRASELAAALAPFALPYTIARERLAAVMAALRGGEGAGVAP